MCTSMIPTKQEPGYGKKLQESSNNVYIPWIPVSERLPEKSEFDWVLVRIEFKDGQSGIPHVAELRNGVWYSQNLDLPLIENVGIKVTHWKPIPDEEIK